MPIRADLKHFYGKEWRTVTRPRILARAADKCEDCGKPNRRVVEQSAQPGPALIWRRLNKRTFGQGSGWRDNHGKKLKGPVWPNNKKLVRVVLTVAHVNHVSGDDRDENLKALCQWCHLNHDREHHRATRQARKDQARPILAELAGAGLQ